jgi:hypothetical protein
VNIRKIFSYYDQVALNALHEEESVVLAFLLVSRCTRGRRGQNRCRCL